MEPCYHRLTQAMNEVAVKSSIATAMGAKVSVLGPSRGMYLVTGKAESLERQVTAAGGVVVLRLNGTKMLATLPFTGYLALRGQRTISHVGPVTVDLKRLAAVAQALSGANAAAASVRTE